VIRSARGRHFVAAEVAKKLASRPTVTPVPGTAFGMALVGGQVVSVIDLGGAPAALLLCEADGQLLALSGIDAERAGFFEAAPGGVSVDGGVAFDLDVDAIARSVSSVQGGPSQPSEPES